MGYRSVYFGNNLGIVEKKMEITLMGFWGLRFRVYRCSGVRVGFRVSGLRGKRMSGSPSFQTPNPKH